MRCPCPYPCLSPSPSLSLGGGADGHRRPRVVLDTPSQIDEFGGCGCGEYFTHRGENDALYWNGA